MTQAKKHHYVSRFYLSGFLKAPTVNDPSPALWVYEKDKEPRASSPVAEGYQNHYYSFVENGERNTEIERWFATLEGQVSGIIRELVRVRRQPDPHERRWLAAFFGTLQTRTPIERQLQDEAYGPAADRFLQDVARDRHAFEALCQSIGFTADFPDAVDETREQILSGQGDALVATDRFRLTAMIHHGIGVADILLKMNWLFAYASGEEAFVTSDNPVVRESSTGPRTVQFRMGVDLPNVTVIVPLTRHVCVLMEKGGLSGIGKAPNQVVRFINKHVMICAQRWMFAGERSYSLNTAFQRHGCQLPLERLDLWFEGKPLSSHLEMNEG